MPRQHKVDAYRAKQAPARRERKPQNAPAPVARAEPAERLQYPCVHRDVGNTGPVRVMGCDMCGQRDKMVYVLPCAIHGECAQWRWTTRRGKKPEHTCDTCAQRQEPVALKNS